MRKKISRRECAGSSRKQGLNGRDRNAPHPLEHRALENLEKGDCKSLRQGLPIHHKDLGDLQSTPFPSPRVQQARRYDSQRKRSGEGIVTCGKVGSSFRASKSW